MKKYPLKRRILYRLLMMPLGLARIADGIVTFLTIGYIVTNFSIKVATRRARFGPKAWEMIQRHEQELDESLGVGPGADFPGHDPGQPGLEGPPGSIGAVSPTGSTAFGE